MTRFQTQHGSRGAVAVGLRTLVTWLFGLLIALGGADHVHAAGYAASITTAYPQLTINPSATQVVWASCNTNAPNGSPWPSAYNTCDDGVSRIMSVGFSFTFGGIAYDRWSMSTNGVIFFETAAVGATSTGNNAYTPVALPAATFGGSLTPPNTVKPALMPFWADLQKNASVAGANNVGQPTNASFYQYEVQTVSGAQVLVVQLKNVVYWNTSPQLYVNMQVQVWSTGQIVYSYGTMQVMTTNPLLRIGLQYPGGGCNALANNQSVSLSNQSYLFSWDTTAATCPTLPTVNHYEIRHDGAATLCAEPVTVLACSSSTAPCPSASIINTQIINASVTVTGVPTTPSATNPNISPPSFNIEPSQPLQTVNLTWAAGSSGTAGLTLNTAVSASNPVRCTNLASTSVYANCNMTVANAACISPPHHYEIQGPASGTSCANQTFVIKAWSDALQTTAYTDGVTTGTLTFAGNPASVPNLGAFTISAGSSTVNITPITFPSTGTTTFSTTATPALVGTTTCNFGGSTSCAFSVASCVTDFNCVETTANAANAADSGSITGHLYTKLASTAFSFDVVARKADGTVATTYASDVDKPVTVELVDGSGATACASRVALSPAVTSQALTFTKAGQPSDLGRKSVSFTVANAYRDVRCRVTDTTNTTVKGCSLDDFSVRPSAVTLVTTANAPAPSVAFPVGTASPTIKAGANFTLQATTSTGTNYAGTLTQDTTKLNPHDPAQAAKAYGGTKGALTPASLTGNAAAVNATYSEVGHLYLGVGSFADTTYTAVDNNANADCIAGSYSDVAAGGKFGCNIGNATEVSLGRFIPDHFDTVVTQGCVAGVFTYSAQPFTVTVTARNGGGAVTTNYAEKFVRNPTLSNAGVTTSITGNALTSANFPVSGATGAGIGTANSVKYTFASATTAPLPVTLRALDVDSVTSSGFTEGIANIRSGRARLRNAYGSERLDLPMTFTTEFWNGGWIDNTADTCTTGVSLSAAIVKGPLALTNVCAWDTGAPGMSGLGCAASGTAANKFSQPPTAGNFKLNFQKSSVTGSVDITATVPIWLQFNWFNAGVVNPRANATFGLFKSPLIYRRENY